MKTSYKWNPHTNETPIQLKTPCKWKPHTNGNPILMETHKNGNENPTDRNPIQMENSIQKAQLKDSCGNRQK
jgi:hypothetical protein